MISENTCVPVDSYHLPLQICVCDSSMSGIDVQHCEVRHDTSLVLGNLCSGICVIISVRQ